LRGVFFDPTNIIINKKFQYGKIAGNQFYQLKIDFLFTPILGLIGIRLEFKEFASERHV
jgi:hypothetical protein